MVEDSEWSEAGPAGAGTAGQSDAGGASRTYRISTETHGRFLAAMD